MTSDLLISTPILYKRLAEKEINKGNPVKGSLLYFRSARSALKKYRNTWDFKEQKYWEGFTRNCIYLGREYRPKSKKVNKIEKKEESKFIPSSDISLNFDDVAGMDDIKKDIERKIIWPITDPEGYSKFVSKGCRGILMYGPPGCGKTLLAKASAGEANKYDRKVSFYKLDQSSIKNKYVGKSEEKMKKAFRTAAENQPAIMFFDEVDSLAGTRNKDNWKHSRDLTNEFKSDFDEIHNKVILVIGATNHPWNIDSAFLRPGRFEESIFVPPPDLEARTKILGIYTKDKNVERNINFSELARISRGYSGADLEKICKDAGSIAYEKYRENKIDKIEYSDFLKSIKRNKSSLEQWCTEVKDQMVDGRYNGKDVLKKGISKEFKVILEEVKKLEKNFK